MRSYAVARARWAQRTFGSSPWIGSACGRYVFGQGYRVFYGPDCFRKAAADSRGGR